VHQDLHDARMGNHTWFLLSLEPAEPGTIGVFAYPYRTKVRNLICTDKVIGWAVWENEKKRHRKDGMYFPLKTLGADEPPCPRMGLPDFLDVFHSMGVFEEEPYFLGYAKEGDDLSVFYPAAREIQAEWFEERLNEVARNISYQSDENGWSDDYALALLEKERKRMLKYQRDIDKERNVREKQRRLRQAPLIRNKEISIPADNVVLREISRPKRTISLKLRFAVLTRDKFTCRYCGRSAPDVPLHIDHVIAYSKGGPTTVDNLVTSCRDCNLGKGAQTLPDS
jgi:5-methylcytosine-specific restriction endonuclease McrA